jgi:hypothetical protein
MPIFYQLTQISSQKTNGKLWKKSTPIALSRNTKKDHNIKKNLRE